MTREMASRWSQRTGGSPRGRRPLPVTPPCWRCCRGSMPKTSRGCWHNCPLPATVDAPRPIRAGDGPRDGPHQEDLIDPRERNELLRRLNEEEAAALAAAGAPEPPDPAMPDTPEAPDTPDTPRPDRASGVGGVDRRPPRLLPARVATRRRSGGRGAGGGRARQRDGE